jgi:hypothetical protein
MLRRWLHRLRSRRVRLPRPGDRFALPGDHDDRIVHRFLTVLVVDGRTRYLVETEDGGKWVIFPIEEEVSRP